MPRVSDAGDTTASETGGECGVSTSMRDDPDLCAKTVAERWQREVGRSPVNDKAALDEGTRRRYFTYQLIN